MMCGNCCDPLRPFLPSVQSMPLSVPPTLPSDLDVPTLTEETRAGGFDRPELESGFVVMATEEVVPLWPRPSLDGLEAACRERMALVVRHGPARGFDTARTRAYLLAQCDAAFDLYLLAASAFDDNEELVP